MFDSRYHPTYYAAYVLDPDGNNIEVVCQAPRIVSPGVTEQSADHQVRPRKPAVALGRLHSKPLLAEEIPML